MELEKLRARLKQMERELKAKTEELTTLYSKCSNFEEEKKALNIKLKLAQESRDKFQADFDKSQRELKIARQKQSSALGDQRRQYAAERDLLSKEYKEKLEEFCRLDPNNMTRTNR